MKMSEYDSDYLNMLKGYYDFFFFWPMAPKSLFNHLNDSWIVKILTNNVLLIDKLANLYII